MRTASKLLQLVALALAGTALATGPAYATTIAEVGNATADQTGPSNLDNGSYGITCQTSTMTATFANSGATTIDTLTLGGCTEDFTGMSCTYIFTNLPQSASTAFVSANVGVMTLNGPTFFGAVVDCGALTCTLQADGRLTIDVGGGSTPRLELVNQPIGIGGDPGCGVGIDGNWNASWTVDTTANGTDTTLTITL